MFKITIFFSIITVFLLVIVFALISSYSNLANESNLSIDNIKNELDSYKVIKNALDQEVSTLKLELARLNKENNTVYIETPCTITEMFNQTPQTIYKVTNNTAFNSTAMKTLKNEVLRLEEQLIMCYDLNRTINVSDKQKYRECQLKLNRIVDLIDEG